MVELNFVNHFSIFILFLHGIISWWKEIYWFNRCSTHPIHVECTLIDQNSIAYYASPVRKKNVEIIIIWHPALFQLIFSSLWSRHCLMKGICCGSLCLQRSKWTLHIQNCAKLDCTYILIIPTYCNPVSCKLLQVFYVILNVEYTTGLC